MATFLAGQRLIGTGPPPRHAAAGRFADVELSSVPYPSRGSMILAEERALSSAPIVIPRGVMLTGSGPRPQFWPNDPVSYEDLQSDARIELAHDWREQTKADLAPEALGGGPAVSGPEGATVVNAPPAQLDSGPGVESSLAPGPDWLGQQLDGHVAWVARMAPLVTGWAAEWAAAA